MPEPSAPAVSEACEQRGCPEHKRRQCLQTHGAHSCPAEELPTFAERPLRARLHRRWDRIGRLLGDPAMQRLAASHVAVFGLGGVGSFAVEGLARSGVGRLTLVDFDVVCATNLNRQLHALKNTIGQSKAQLMAARVGAINPEVQVRGVQRFYDAASSEALLQPRPDFVVDAIDNITAKLHLLATCQRLALPVVSSMGAAAKLDPTQVRVDDLSRTHTDPLARSIRKLLKQRYAIDCSRPTGIDAVFSAEEVRAPLPLPYDGDEGFRCVCPHGADSPHGCDERPVIYGTAGFVTSAFGMACASVVVRRLAEAAQSRE